MKRIAPFLIILAVLGVALGSAWYLTKPVSTGRTNTNTTTSRPAVATTSQATPARPPVRTGVPGAEPAHTKGPANAPAQLEEFGDFQCPPCAAFHPILEEMERQFGNQLRVTFRHFPLVPRHQHALRAASAAEAAGMQGKFWEMHGLIYEHQNDWKGLSDVQPVFEGYAKQIGLDLERYKRDVTSEAVAQRIFNDGKRAHSLGVGGTPSVFLNGREVPFENFAPDRLRVLIQQEIDSAAKK